MKTGTPPGIFQAGERSESSLTSDTSLAEPSFCKNLALPGEPSSAGGITTFGGAVWRPTVGGVIGRNFDGMVSLMPPFYSLQTAMKSDNYMQGLGNRHFALE